MKRDLSSARAAVAVLERDLCDVLLAREAPMEEGIDFA